MKKTYLSLPYNKERDERIYPLTWKELHIGVKINCREKNKQKLWLFLWGYHNLKMLICKSKYLKINIFLEIIRGRRQTSQSKEQSLHKEITLEQDLTEMVGEKCMLCVSQQDYN